MTMYNPFFALLVAILIAAALLVLFWPQRGLVARWRQSRRMTRRVLIEDALKHIYKCEVGGQAPTLASIAGTLNVNLNQTAELVAEMEADGLVHTERGEISLTDTGREAALHIIRAHRLWERYLSEETGLNEQDWHERAEQWEHSISPEDANALSAQLGHPNYDPHGDPIPSARGEIRAHGGQPLSRMDAGSVARIVHLEDEPEVVYAQLLAEGLHLGEIVRVTEVSSDRVRFWTNGSEHLVAPIVAANISVVPLERMETVAEEVGDSIPLSILKPGEAAEVITISPSSRGAERRRFLDLGILPGTKITAEFESPSGNPVAYKVRGAVIALREGQAENIKVKRLESKS
jgi:DtxR family transcriptional regulator, Mn-dependent transcriptional regulator